MLLLGTSCQHPWVSGQTLQHAKLLWRMFSVLPSSLVGSLMEHRFKPVLAFQEASRLVSTMQDTETQRKAISNLLCVQAAPSGATQAGFKPIGNLTRELPV